MTCAQCSECPEGWTGSQTCTGSVCFVQVTDQGSIDRGCLRELLIGDLCNQTTRETDGTRAYNWCCNESDLCNENNTLSNISDFLIPTPTATPTITPSTNATSSTGRHNTPVS